MEHFIWPGVVVLLVGFALCLLRKSLSRLVDRITHIDKTGVRAAAQEVAEIEEKRMIPSRDLMEVAFSSVIKDQEKLLRDYLENIRFGSPQEREALLLRTLARSQVYAQFDRISMLIYGSQLELLVDASSRPAGIDADGVKEKFRAVKSADPAFHEQTTFDSYRNFLLGTNLLGIEGDRLKITQFGKEFLKFLVDNALTHRRRG
jgi:hypothetical protein